MKCFRCHQKGHVAAKCPNSQASSESTRRITTTAGDETEEMWIRVGVVTTDKETIAKELPNVDITGPTYKVDVTVEGLKTRALIDNGSQVSLVRTEMLPRLKEMNNWTLEEYKKRTHQASRCWRSSTRSQKDCCYFSHAGGHRQVNMCSVLCIGFRKTTVARDCEELWVDLRDQCHNYTWNAVDTLKW